MAVPGPTLSSARIGRTPAPRRGAAVQKPLPTKSAQEPEFREITSGTTDSRTYSAADQLTAVSGSAVTSDASGNLTQDDSGALYSWDVRGRLIGLTKGGSAYVFTYGPDNLRTSRSVNGVLTTYLLDGDQVVTDTVNGTANQTLYGPGTDHALARNGAYFLPNHLNRTTGLTNGSGALTQSYLRRGEAT